MAGEGDEIMVKRVYAPFIPRDVTPWFTALRAYSSGVVCQ